jgi:L-ascorbate metabolism protein UlaG (beta-lactamase superfamily)
MSWLQPAVREGRRFLNPIPTELGGLSVMMKVLPHYLTNKEERVPRVPLGPFRTDTEAYATAPRSGLRITWFGHSSLLIEIDGVRVLVDPVWDERASPTRLFGPKRFFAPTLALEELPSLDAVLISHDHYDHLGESTVRRLAALRPQTRWITSLGVGASLRKFGVADNVITELDWTGETILTSSTGSSCRITSLPARHFSGRSLRNRFETLWASFVLRGPNHSIYYGADSGLWPGFDQIGRTYGPFDVTLLEIGAFDRLWHNIHLGPQGAAEAYRALGASGLLMPIHWGLFDLALHAWREPIENLEALSVTENLPLWSPVPGVPTEIDGTALLSRWWAQPHFPVSSAERTAGR